MTERARSLARGVVGGWRAPQHRDGMALVLSSGISSVIGLLFWVLAARMFDPAVVGVGSAALSAMTLLGSAAHLNMGNAMLRFVPVAGGRAKAIVMGCFAVGAGVGTVLGLGFAAGAGFWAPELVEGFGYPALIGFFAVSTPIWTLFVLQDAALTSIRRADLVLVENAVFALLKIGMLVLAAVLAVPGGIAVSWVVATVLVVLVVIGFLARALPSGAGRPGEPVTARDLAGFVRADYAGNIFWQAAVFGLPLVVIALAGAEGAATYGVIWQIGFGLYLVAIGMGKSMVTHAAGDPTKAERARRGMERKALTLIVPAAVVIVVAAHPLLSLFGRAYAESGSVLLVLLALSAIPHVVTASTTWAARIHRNGAVLVGLPAATSVCVITGTVVLVPMIGVAGAGWAWLGTQSVAAAVILLLRAGRRGRKAPPRHRATPPPRWARAGGTAS
ncbi:lipopolysaccharide biosynthesis protein [Pseudonocardia sichuanensis]